jgi:AcrR family transcriptional regulator
VGPLTVMGIQERRNREKQLLRQEILDAAREMFVREGYEGVSMRKIADRIEYSPTTIYHYFDDKADLLSQIIMESFSKLCSEMSTIIGGTEADAGEALWRGMLAYVQFGLNNPSHYYLTFMHTQCSADDAPLDAEAHQLGMKAFDYLRQAVKRAMEGRHIRQADLEVTSQSAWAGLHGVTSLIISLDGHFPFVEREQLITESLCMLLRGMGMDVTAEMEGSIRKEA